MDYNDLKAYIDNPLSQVIADLPRWLRGPYDPRHFVCHEFGGSGGHYVDERRQCGCTSDDGICPFCNDMGFYDLEAEADRELEKNSLPSLNYYRAFTDWSLDYIDGWFTWFKGEAINSEIITTAELRAHLPIDFSRKDDECASPTVARKKPDPVSDPGDRCMCSPIKEGSTTLTRLWPGKASCIFCDGTGTIQPPGNGTCSLGIPITYTMWETIKSQRQIRHDEYVRRNKVGACSLLCHWTNPDNGWYFNNSLLSKHTADRVRAFLYDKYGADLCPT